MASEDDLIEAAPCPNCRSPLTVSAADLGHLVECPSCGTQFRAKRTGSEVPPSRNRDEDPPPRRSRDEDPPPSRRRPREEDPPPRRRSREDEFEDEDRRDRFGEERGERDYDDDRPRRSTGRSRFDDRDYDDRPRPRKTPGALLAMAIMDFIYAGILLICGALGIIGLVFINKLQGQANAPPINNMALEIGLVFGYLGTALVMLFAGIMVLRRQGYGLSVTALLMAAVVFLLGIANAVMTIQKRPQGGQAPPGEEVGMVCGVAMLAIFWLGYLVTNGILLAKGGRHFK